MWEKYGDNYQGYCVGFDASVLAKYCSGGGDVQYVKGIPSIDFMNDSDCVKIEKQLLSKSQIWAFEDEYRFLKIGKNVLTNQERIVLLPQESIREVYLGKNMSKNDRIEVMEIVQARYSNAIIFVVVGFSWAQEGRLNSVAPVLPNLQFGRSEYQHLQCANE